MMCFSCNFSTIAATASSSERSFKIVPAPFACFVKDFLTLVGEPFNPIFPSLTVSLISSNPHTLTSFFDHDMHQIHREQTYILDQQVQLMLLKDKVSSPR